MVRGASSRIGIFSAVFCFLFLGSNVVHAKHGKVKISSIDDGAIKREQVVAKKISKLDDSANEHQPPQCANTKEQREKSAQNTGLRPVKELKRVVQRQHGKVKISLIDDGASQHGKVKISPIDDIVNCAKHGKVKISKLDDSANEKSAQKTIAALKQSYEKTIAALKQFHEEHVVQIKIWKKALDDALKKAESQLQKAEQLQTAEELQKEKGRRGIMQRLRFTLQPVLKTKSPRTFISKAYHKIDWAINLSIVYYNIDENYTNERKDIILKLLQATGYLPEKNIDGIVPVPKSQADEVDGIVTLNEKNKEVKAIRKMISIIHEKMPKSQADAVDGIVEHKKFINEKIPVPKKPRALLNFDPSVDPAEQTVSAVDLAQ